MGVEIHRVCLRVDQLLPHTTTLRRPRRRCRPRRRRRRPLAPRSVPRDLCFLYSAIGIDAGTDADGFEVVRLAKNFTLNID